MRELHSFIVMASHIAAEPKEPVEINTKSHSFLLMDQRFLLHPLADGAVLMARALLYFLGLKLVGNVLSAAAHSGSDIGMGDVGLFPVSEEMAVKGWAIPEDRAKALFELSIRTGNKVSGHLTTRSAYGLGASISELTEAFELVNALVNRQVYVALRMSPITFTAKGRAGHIVTKSR
jgi:hypothetical protein